MLRQLLCACLALSALAGAKATWDVVGTPAPAEPITVTLALRQCNVDRLARIVDEVSDPTSTSYGQHLSTAAVQNVLQCDQSPLDSVLAVLREHGVDTTASVHTQPDPAFVSVDLTVGLAEKLFAVSLLTHSPDSGVTTAILSRTAPVVPAPLRDGVEVVLGLTLRPNPRQSLSVRTPQVGQPAAGTSSAPNLVGVVCSDTTVYVQFNPTCKDGSTAGPDLCASNPPAITSFTLAEFVNGTNSGIHTLSCSTSRAAEDGSGAVYCQDQAPTTAAFTLITVKLAANYADGSQGDIATATPIMSTPFVDVALLETVYGIPSPTNQQPYSKYNQSVVEFSHNYFAMADLSAFFKYNNMNPSVGVGVVGPNNANDPEGEADQDMQWIMGTGRMIDTIFWSTQNANGFFLDWLQEVASTPDATVPRVFSISYGNPEALSNKQFGANYIQRSEVEFMKLAARGISVTMADGDSGASSALGCSKLWPDWPATSAYVTSCGASTLSSYQLPATTVAVCSATGVSYTTGGGFSEVFPQPSYQQAAVQSFLTEHADTLPPKALFNASGRGFPDVATLGYNMLTFYAGQNWVNPFPGGGTSFSAPTMGGMIALMNEHRAASGLPPMGLINHWLYSTAASCSDCFYDITVGDNKSYMGGYPACPIGYECTTGWDPVSGLGSPVFSKLLQLVNKPFE